MEEDPYVISNLYILENAHSDPAITIKDVTSHFVITGCYIIGGQYNIYIDSIENGIATITNNSCLLGEYAGIHIVNTARHNITNNTIAYALGPGIYAWACDEMNIINNTCAFNSEGISLTYSNRFKIESNRCLNNGYIGIDLHTYSLFDGPVIGTICRNICIGNYIGIAISNDDGQMLNVSENIVIKNSNTGIRAFSVNASIFNNTIQYNRVGIFSRRLENCDIYNNLIQYNTDFGIEIEVTSYVLENIRIYHNYFDGNGDSNHSQVFCDSGILETQWFDETISEGNIWTDWNGTGSYYFETSEDVTNDTYDPYPLLANDTDSDGDGLTDFEEVILSTNPLSSDSDNDFLPDYWEVHNDLNPLHNDAQEDPDADLQSNLREYSLGRDPHTWDNWALLFGGYLLPLWFVLLAFLALMSMISYNHILRRRRGFLSIKDMKDAKEIGFLKGNDYYLAIATGFSTRQQWVSSQEAGFQTEDEWIQAMKSGYNDVNTRDQVEELGFKSIFDLQKKLISILSKLRHRMNNILTQIVEFEQVDSKGSSRANKIKTTIRKNYNECKILIEELIHISKVSSGIPNINKVIKTEIERSETLFEKAKTIFTK